MVVFPVLCAALFALTVAQNHCSIYIASTGEVKPLIFCGQFWGESDFCCGTCADRYCCSNPLKKITQAQQTKCLSNSLRKQSMNLRRNLAQSFDPMIIAFISIGVALVFILLLLICCVCRKCYLYKKCRNPRPKCGTVTSTTTVVAAQHLPQHTVVNRNQYPSYQPVLSNPEYGGHPAYGGHPMPTAPYLGPPCVPGPPPSYQEAGSGCPVSHSQAAHNSGQTTYPPQAPAGASHEPLSTGYTPPPAFNPAYVDSAKTGC